MRGRPADGADEAHEAELILGGEQHREPAGASAKVRAPPAQEAVQASIRNRLVVVPDKMLRLARDLIVAANQKSGCVLTENATFCRSTADIRRWSATTQSDN
jgi:hypothetical protein